MTFGKFAATRMPGVLRFAAGIAARLRQDHPPAQFNTRSSPTRTSRPGGCSRRQMRMPAPPTRIGCHGRRYSVIWPLLAQRGLRG